MSPIEVGDNVFLWLPNVIGYARIILAMISLYFMPQHPYSCTLLYSVSCLLDALDGYIARAYNQSSRFGAVLDMVTDRCTTTCLLVFLASAMPAYAILFQGLICLDLASHYMHMYATLSIGGESHKNVSGVGSRILEFYYDKYVLFTCCALNELFFISLYLLCFTASAADAQTTFLPASTLLAKEDQAEQCIALCSPYLAAASGIARINKVKTNLPWKLAVLSSPVMLFKQGVNVVQLVSASQVLAEKDLQGREKVKSK